MKKIIMLLLIIAMAFTLSACGLLNLGKRISDAADKLGDVAGALEGIGGSSGENNKLSFLSREEVEKKLNNYKITYTTYSNDEKDDAYIVTEMRCGEGYALIMGDWMTLVEYGAGRLYQLDTESKSGTVMTLDADDEEGYMGFGGFLSDSLFFHNSYDSSFMVKAGSDRIAGRSTTSYTFKILSYEYKFWVDDEYGVTLKYFWSYEGESATMEITEFKVGGITLSDMVDFGQYDDDDIIDLTDLFNY